ncbi:hypothetical protein EVAR_38404_1 [Eumeta japonica]|uniref:Uncharacterized protein n=1 Tax=Eumeta variegata TaxID=151549 RepID=A0A4C1YJV5_EUMVA|nr:hypothetical protein EVAR_38404_1 [Eumeta japonica]
MSEYPANHDIIIGMYLRDRDALVVTSEFLHIATYRYKARNSDPAKLVTKASQCIGTRRRRKGPIALYLRIVSLAGSSDGRVSCGYTNDVESRLIPNYTYSRSHCTNTTKIFILQQTLLGKR